MNLPILTLFALCALQPIQAMKSNNLDAPLNKRLIKATKKGDLQTATQLIAAGACVNPRHIHPQIKPCLDGQHCEICTCHPLIIAAERGFTDICKLLIAKKANINEKNCWGRTALHQASWEGDEEIVSLLLAAGATVNWRRAVDVSASKLNLTAREIILNQQLIKATLVGNTVQIAQLIEQGANANPQYVHGHRHSQAPGQRDSECHCYPLVLAAKKGSTGICKLLIANSANANDKNCWGETALHEASREGHEEIVLQLLHANANTHETNRDGENALNLAIRGQNGEWQSIVQILIDANTNLFQKSYSRQESALYWLAFHTREPSNHQGTIHPLCDLYVQKMLETPSESQSKRLITLFCCLNKRGGYRDLYKLFKAPLLAAIAEENSEDRESRACRMIEGISTQRVKEALLKKYIKVPKESASDDGVCVIC